MHAPNPIPLWSRSGSRVRIARYPNAGRYWPHAHDLSCVTLVVRGGFREQVGREDREADPLTLIVKPAGVVHANDFAPGTDTVQVYLSTAEEAALCTLGEMAAWRCEPASRAAPVMLRLAALVRPGAPAAEPGTIDDSIVELIAALRAHQPADDAAPRWLETARAALETPRTTIREAAAACGVHPVHLARAFRRCSGESPTAFRHRVRLRRAAALLANGAMPLAEAALAAGYADQAHMTRDLTRHCGMSPLHLRRLAASF
jgi:AraC family transcriptional regulator